MHQITSICKVIDHNEDTEQSLVLLFLLVFDDGKLILEDLFQLGWLPFVEEGWLLLQINFQIVFNVLFDREPGHVDMDRGRKDVDPRKTTAVLVQNEADQTSTLARATAPDQGTADGHLGQVLEHTLALSVLRRREELNFRHSKWLYLTG